MDVEEIVSCAKWLVRDKRVVARDLPDMISSRLQLGCRTSVAGRAEVAGR